MCNSSAKDETEDDDDAVGCCDGLVDEDFILVDGTVVGADASVDDNDGVGVADTALILSENDSAASPLLLAADDDGLLLFAVALLVDAALSKFFFLDARASCSAKLIIIIMWLYTIIIDAKTIFDSLLNGR